MQKRTLRILISVVAISALLLGAVLYLQLGTGTRAAKASPVSNQLSKIQQRILSGSLSLDRDMQSASKSAAKALNYFPTSDDGCPQNRGTNVKVNQNCLNLSDTTLQGRGQAQDETAIAQDPNNPNHIVATYNDYRRGDGNCGTSFSLDGGQTWADSTVPSGFTPGTNFGGVAREYWQAGTDPSVAWDTKGNAYFDCELFQRGPGTTNNPDQSSAIYIFRSTGNKGASWNFPGRPAAEQFTTGTPFGLPTLDKPYMAIDNHVGSPFQDRIYATYTLFGADGTALLYESHSNDYGESFSSPVLVSASSPLCTNSFGLPTTTSTCNENQFSNPFVGQDGALYVTYQNFNNTVTGSDNRNQILLVKSTDGGATFSAPVLVGDWYDLPDCFTFQGGQDAGRACVPEKGKEMNSVFRATNYPVGQVDPTNSSKVVVTFGSYINKDSNESNGCAPAGLQPVFGTNLYTGVKTPGACSNKILISVSTNGGATFTGTTTDPRQLPVVNQAPGQVHTDQWWQWSAFTPSGKLAVSYYDRQYGQDEFNGNMDISLSGSNNGVQQFNAARVTSTSMPVPTEFPDAQGNSLFFGDYSGLSVINQTAHPLWMDTRSPDLALCPGSGVPGVPPAVCKFFEPDGLQANDEDIFTQAINVP